MSTATFEIIYGIPLVHSYKNLSDELEELIASKEHSLIETRYSDSADQLPAFCGVSIGAFDERVVVVELSHMNLTPSKEQIAEFTTAFHKMPTDVQAMIKEYGGEPRVFVLPYSS